AWKSYSLDKLKSAYKEFRNHVDQNPTQLQLLGYSYNWAGRTDEEIEDLWRNKKCLVPSNTCDVVNKLLYFVPGNNDLFLCNCVPHRSRDRYLSIKVKEGVIDGNNLKEVANWLHENGPK